MTSDSPSADKKSPQSPPATGFFSRLVDRIVAPLAEKQADTATDWEQDSEAAYLEQQPLRAKFLLYAIVAIVIILVLWAALAQMNEVTRGVGKVIPSRQVQIIQSQDGGVVSEILVREGDIVAKDQLLVRLDQTRSASSFRENRAEFQALEVRAARLQAVADQTEFRPRQDLLESVPGIVAQETQLYISSLEQLELEQQIYEQQYMQRQNELEEVTALETQLARSLDLTQQELQATRPMVKSGAVSKVDILRLDKEVNRLAGELAQSVAQKSRIESSVGEAERKMREVKLKFLGSERQKLTDTIAKINSLRELGTGLSDRVEQTALRSPVNGTVKKLYFNTIGGVVLPGREIIEIVPLDDTLLLDVRIQPKDIAFLVPGQKALVKFSAYDFIVYGQLEGTVEHIGVDTVMDEKGNPFYGVKVRTVEPSLGENMPILPGMTVEVDILTGKKTVLAYLLKPVLRAKQVAMTER